MKISRSRSSLAPNGLLVSIGLRRTNGSLAQLCLDLPVNTAGVIMGHPAVKYTEEYQGEVLFHASRAAGRIEMGFTKGCPCQTGRLELVLTDAGEDGTLDTNDDLTRRISQARLRFDDRPFCHQKSILKVKEELLVVGFRACPAGRANSRGGIIGSFAWNQSGAADSTWNSDTWYDETWAGDDPEGWEFFESWDGDPNDQGGSAVESDGDSAWEDDSGWDDGDDSDWDDWEDDSGWDDGDDSDWDDWEDDSGWDDGDDSDWDDWEDDSGWDDGDDSDWDDE